MNHHRRVDALECTFARHLDFSSATLFGGRSHQSQVASALLDHARERDARPKAGSGDDVVTTSMADARQSVVFTEHRDRRPRTTLDRYVEGRVEIVGAAFDAQLLIGDVIGQNLVCKVFFKVGFGMRMNLTAYLDQVA
jgi:hypothetical protein